MRSLILVVDDESDVEMLFRQQFRRELRAGRFTMDFAPSGDSAFQHINDTGGASLVLILSDINNQFRTHAFRSKPSASASSFAGASRPSAPFEILSIASARYRA